MSGRLEELVESLLYEGYALYPYTPGATKNATPTPFGIVYPPAYADRNPSCHSLLRIQCVVEGEGDVWAEVLFLQGVGRAPRGGAAPDRAHRPGRVRVPPSAASRPGEHAGGGARATAAGWSRSPCTTTPAWPIRAPGARTR